MIRLLLNILALLIVAYLVPGVSFEDFVSVFVASIVIGIINTLIKPILQIIALPITLLTFGVFALVINVLLLMLAGFIVPGFDIDGFWTALVASIVLSLVSWFLGHLAKD